MSSHLFTFTYPDRVVAVISNVGYIHEGTIKDKARYPPGQDLRLLDRPRRLQLQIDEKKIIRS